MSTSDYTFTGQVENFDINDYIAHLGWRAAKINDLKIYTLPGSSSYYLHDEVIDRLFEFDTVYPEKLHSEQEYECVVKAYKETYENRH